jgi:hypothetical protein
MSETRIPLHTRTIRASAVRVSDTEIEVTGQLVDDRAEPEDWFGLSSGLVIHDMQVTVRVRHPGLVVTAVSAAMDSRPTRCVPTPSRHCSNSWVSRSPRASPAP